MLDPETAAKLLTAFGAHGPPGFALDSQAVCGHLAAFAAGSGRCCPVVGYIALNDASMGVVEDAFGEHDWAMTYSNRLDNCACGLFGSSSVSHKHRINKLSSFS